MLMFSDTFYDIGSGEIFKKSCCMSKEQEVANLLINKLIDLGYTTQDPFRRVWKFQCKQVIVCLADDFVVCGANRNNGATKWFDSNTTVITDGYMPYPTEYTVCKLPPSYFGVFNYVPELQSFKPTRRFGLSINRMDGQRISILLELIASSGGLDQILTQDWINFNGFDAAAENLSKDNVDSNFLKYWKQVSSYYGNKYTVHIPEIMSALPIRNHNFSVEQAHVNCYLNLVIETYAGNATIAFSEKIFRALVTPAPWMLYSACHALEYLRSLGFDLLDDLLDHSYDSVIQEYPGQYKIANFIKVAQQNYQKLISMELSDIIKCCQRATTHNQKLLTQFSQQWPTDFEKFSSNLTKIL